LERLDTKISLRRWSVANVVVCSAAVFLNIVAWAFTLESDRVNVPDGICNQLASQYFPLW